MRSAIYLGCASGLLILLGTGCATYKSTLTNAQGQTMTCEVSGKNGLITGLYLRQSFETCIADAKAKGYKE